jgi:hypothetical protein
LQGAPAYEQLSDGGTPMNLHGRDDRVVNIPDIYEIFWAESSI